MKTKDLRSIRTQNAIQNAFIELLQKNNFNKVTVSAIAKNAYIDRQTFYLHYTDKYDLLEKMCDQINDQFNTIFSERVEKGNALQKIQHILNEHYDYLDSHSKEILSLLKIDTGDICLKRSLKEAFIDRYQKENNITLTPLEADVMSTLYIQTITELLKNKKNIDISEIQNLLEKIRGFLY